MLPERAVCLDAQGAQNRAHFDRGIPRFVLEQLRGVVQAAPGAVHSVALNPWRPLTGNLEWLVGSGRLQWNTVQGPGPRPRPALYHAMSPFELDRDLEELWPLWARRAGTGLVVTLYDLIPLIFEDHYLRAPMLRARYLARAEMIRQADQVLAISQSTADDAHRLLGVAEDKLTIIDAGVSGLFSETFATDAHAWGVVGERFAAIRPGFLFYVAGIEWRKNIERLIEAYGRMDPAVRTAHQLVITCRIGEADRAELRAAAVAGGVGDAELILTGYATDTELAALYRVCRLFVFASFYEGSGLPVLEAMAAGVPVCASNTSTSPEILGDLEATFDPHDAGDMARVIAATVTDDVLLDRLRERSARRVAQYTWAGTAEKTVAGYERALAAGSRRVGRRQRPRIALYSPWPPDRSGIATYNRRLVECLGERADVDVVVGGEPATYPAPQEPGTRLRFADEDAGLGRLRPADRVVYCMGNSHFHGYVYEALRRRFGIVVAHDVRLTGFYGWLSGQERPEDPTARLGERIDAMYAHRIGEGAFAERPPTPDEQSALGLYMTHELQEYAHRVLVHSEHARDLLRLDLPQHRSATAPPVDVIPLAFPDVVPRPERVADPAAPLIVTFGVVSAVKQPHLLIEAVAQLALDRPGLRLVFAGGADDAELARWRTLADDLGAGDRVELPGHVDDATYRRLLADADVAVQLRALSNGEASAAVADCVAAGLPTVVTEGGWFAELPDGAVTRVPVEVSPAGVAEAIAAIVDHPHRAAAMTAAAQAHAGGASFPAVARRYLEILELA